jgi:hypothetical protein
MFDSEVLHDLEPFVKVDNYAVESAAVAATYAFPVCEVPPGNKIQLDFTYIEIKNKRLL